MNNYTKYFESMDWEKLATLMHPDDQTAFGEYIYTNCLCYPEFRKMTLGDSINISDMKRFTTEKLIGSFFNSIYSLVFRYDQNIKFKTEVVGSVKQDSITYQYVVKTTLIMGENEKSETEVTVVQKVNNNYYVRLMEKEKSFLRMPIPKGVAYTFPDTRNKLLFAVRPDSLIFSGIKLDEKIIKVLDLSSGKSAKITNDNFDSGSPRFNNDGSKIYFQSNRSMFVPDYKPNLYYQELSSGQIYSIKNELPDLFEDDSRFYDGEWSVNSDLAICLSGYPDSLFILNNNKNTKVTIDSMGTFLNIRWSNDGNSLYYLKTTKNKPDTNYYYKGYIYNSGKSKLIIDSTVSYTFIDWFPDTRKILFLDHSDTTKRSYISYDVERNEFKPWLKIDKSEGWIVCFGKTENDLFFQRKESEESFDIWLYNKTDNTFKQITDDGEEKWDVYYSRQ